MKVLHPDPRPTAPRAHAFPPGHVVAAVLAPVPPLLAPVPPLLASCTDDVAANSPLKHPEVLTVAAAGGNPCAMRKRESGALLALPTAEVGR